MTKKGVENDTRGTRPFHVALAHDAGDAAILKAQHWLSANRAKAVTVADMARSAGLEPRTFLRRFVRATGLKPSDYQRRLRVMRAREMLEFTRSPVDAIAVAVGYSDVRNFRRVFSDVVGLTPSDYRRRFSRLPRDRPHAPNRMLQTSEY